MPRKKLDILKSLSLEKNQFILNQLDDFEKLINNSAFILSEILVKEFLEKLDAENGELANTTDNVRRVALIDQAWKKFQEQQGIQIITAFVSDLSEIARLNSKYYTELIPNQVESKQVEKIINEKLGLIWEGKQWSPKPNGYIDSLIKDKSIVSDIKKIAYNNIIARSGPTSLRKALDNYIIGKGEDPGRYNKFFKQYTFDTYSQVDRLNSSMHADRLKLRYFLFNGGLIRDSREFCKKHAGKCYSTEEAEKWRELIGKYKLVPGKRKAQVKEPIGPIVEDKETYDPVRDLGGIACRHSADFVSDEIAAELRKKQKTEEDKGFDTDDKVIKNIDAIKKNKQDTFGFYRNPDGSFTPERVRLHNDIIKGFTKNPQKKASNTIHMLGGAPANGKSTLQKSGFLPHSNRAIVLDPDEIKAKLPEYQKMLKDKDIQAASLAHEESSYLKKKIRQMAIDEDWEIVLDGLANETLEDRIKELKILRSKGDRVRIDYVTLDTEKSIEIEADRFKETGRKVPDEVVIRKNKAIAELVPQLIKEKVYDELYLWDTNVRDQPQLILKQIDGKLEIKRPDLYDRFKKKAK
jgi:predicted ABC-type ATPase